MLKTVTARTVMFLLLLFVAGGQLGSQQRFPKPEFESGYVQPNPTTPEPRAIALEYFLARR
jgi:NosR/NirI family nitrous oxide reductase transcriptional regulator